MTDPQQPAYAPQPEPAPAEPALAPPAEPGYASPAGTAYSAEPAYATPAAPEQARTNGLGIAGLVIGIVALVLGLIPFVGYVGAFLAFVGLVLGVIALVLKGRRRGAAIAGTITSAVALILSIVLSVVYTAVLVAGVNQAVEEAAPDVQDLAAEVPAEEEAPLAGDGAEADVLLLGQTMVWNDGIEMTVSGPGAFEPSATASGVEPGQAAVYFEITLANNSSEQLEPLALSLVSSGGADGAYIVDVESGIHGAPADILLPGETVTWQEAYAVLDPADIAFRTSPGLLYDEAIWTID